MPVILALALALSASLLTLNMTKDVQKLIDRIDFYQEEDVTSLQARTELLGFLEKLSDSSISQNERFKPFKMPQWFSVFSGQVFNPSLWIDWNDEQRFRSAKGMKSTGDVNILDQLTHVTQCFGEKKKLAILLFDLCVQKKLPDNVVFFPENTGLDINRASLTQLKWVIPDLSEMHWSKLLTERTKTPFNSLLDLNERVPELLKVSPLPNALQIQSRYVWMRWNAVNNHLIWLFDLQSDLDGSRILMMKEE